MNGPASRRNAAPATAITMQILTACLALGAATSAIIFVVLPPPQQPNPQSPLFWVALAVAIAAPIVALVARSVFAAAARKQLLDRPPANSDAERDAQRTFLRQQFAVRLIVTLALFEGPAMLAAITYFMTREPLILIAVAVFIVGILAHFPTHDRVEGWIDDQLRQVEDARQFG